MINSFYIKNPSLILYFLLIISLPFFSVRHESFTGSMPLNFLFIIALFTVVKVILIDRRIKKVFCFFDFLIFLYVAYASYIYILQIHQKTDITPILKTIVYFLLYLTLKYLISTNKPEEIARSTLHGILIGTLLFLLIVLYALYVEGILGTIISGGISYWEFTYKIYGALSSFLVGTVEYRSKDIMRSSLSEVFSFYFIAMMVLARYTKAKPLILCFIPVNFFYVVACFSRRSLLSAVISPILLLLSSSKKLWIKVVSVSFFFILIYISVFIIASESRLTDMGDTKNARGSQYSLAFDRINEKPILGYGYGAKIKVDRIEGDRYVHNFIIASAYMMGVFGLIVSVCIYYYLIYGYIRGILKTFTMQYSYLLIIPIFGLTVGSTVEGIFTIPSWIIIALYTSSQRHNHNL